MRILLISDADNGGGCVFQARAINKYTEHQAWAVRMQDSYIHHPHDLLNPSPSELDDLLAWADVVHGRDSIIISEEKLARKPVVMTFTGMSYRRKAAMLVKYCRNRNWLPTVSTIDLTLYVPADPPIWIPNPREDMADAREAAARQRRKKPFTVCQSPTYRDRKGTDMLIEAAKKAGMALELIEQVTYDECLTHRLMCHVTVDQFWFGYGNSAIESWATGIMPVVGGVKDQKFADVVKDIFGGELPYAESAADIDSLADVLARLRDDKDFYKETAERGRRYFFEFHHAPVVAKKLIGLYEQAIELKPPAIKVARPRTKAMTKRAAKLRAPVIKVTKPTTKRAVKPRAPVVLKGSYKVLEVGEWDYAACGYFLSQAINQRTSCKSRAVKWAASALAFPTDIVAPTDEEFLDLWLWADVIHIHDAMRKLGIALPPKPTVVTYHGTKYRAHPVHFNALVKNQGWIGTVATHDLTLHGLPWLPDCRPDLVQYANRKRGKFVVCHAPTKRDIKGTATVLEGAAGFDLDVVENIPWEECLRRKGRAAVTVDQFVHGYCCNATEAWTMGQAVVAGGPPEVLGAVKKDVGFIPFVECKEDPAELQVALTQLRDNRGFHKEMARKGRECYDLFHSPLAVAKFAMRYFDMALSFDEAQEVPVVNSGLTRVEYLGNNVGKETWKGVITRQKYESYGPGSIMKVDERDLATGSSYKPGLLEIVDKRTGKKIFRKI